MKTIFFNITSAFLLLICSQLTFAQQDKHPGDTTVTFKVKGACDQCKNRIETTLKRKGIRSATWDVDTKMLQVVFNNQQVSLEKIHTWIAGVGHDTELKKAKDAVYQALPECCHYREMDEESEKIQAAVSGSIHADSLHTSATPDSNAHHEKGFAIRGVVLEEDHKGNLKPLGGASVMWLGNNAGSMTDNNGVFKIPYDGSMKRLIVSYAGFRPDTMVVRDTMDLKIVLASRSQLQEVKVIGKQRSTSVSAFSIVRTQNMSEKELFKAACCNLSESFETNPSVDVSYNDAITGSKQIQLLGLSGNYTQLTVENLPGPRGLATPLGLNTIAGPWVESIQLTKGVGSVVNGYESIAGQINVELKKPEKSEQLYANAYVNDQGKTDVNLNLSKKIGSKWSTGLLLHDDFLQTKMDYNKDGFRDLPTGNLFSAINRWKFDDNKGFMTQFGIKILRDNRTGGEVLFDPENKLTTNHYGLGIDTRRYEGFAKIGYVFPEKKYKSVGLQLSGFDHDQQSYFGLTTYDANQKNFYSNLIYQSIINNTAHKFRTGLSFVYDRYNELLNVSSFKRTEAVAGAFFEYTYSYLDKFNIVAGIRADHHSIFGWFATPRLHVRYEPVKGTVIRLTSGRGQRTANIIAENNSILASSRQMEIIGSDPRKPYGLDAEVAWNNGISIDQSFHFFERHASMSIDFYRTDFKNQVVVDLEDPRFVKFYNLQGKSWSNSLQAELNVELLRDLETRFAYRFFDVKTTYGNQLLQRPLVARHRAFANVAYSTGGWKFDYTINYTGQKRIPSTQSNIPAYQRPGTSPSYILMNAQVTKSFGKKNLFDIYVGAENITNYFQKDAIIAADQPFGPYFDASMVWGPVSGRMFYTGIRFKIK